MKKWIKINLFLLLGLLLTVSILNYTVDPFWCFEHQNNLNQYQKATNERQQKANYIYFTSKQYDTILLGSSRTTHMNRHAFKGMNVFNFSASSMRPQEYKTYIDFVIHDAKQPIQNIIIGTDFFGYLSSGRFICDNPSSIVRATKSPFYRWKLLFSYNTLSNTFKNIRNTFISSKRSDFYNRDEVKTMIRQTVDTRKYGEIPQDVIDFSRTEYAGNPNPNYYQILNDIKNTYNNKKIIIYTTPISKALFDQMVYMGHYPHYEQWLRDLVAIYGSVYHFMYLSPIATNYIAYFKDSHHAYPETNALIAQKIASQCISEPKNFGMILTRENIETKLQELRVLNGVSQ